MRRNELRTVSGYIEALIDALEDTNWNIVKIVCPSISEGGEMASYEYDVMVRGKTKKARSRAFRREEDREIIGRFEHAFTWQECQFEDSCFGQMMFPIEGTKNYVVIDFQC